MLCDSKNKTARNCETGRRFVGGGAGICWSGEARRSPIGFDGERGWRGERSEELACVGVTFAPVVFPSLKSDVKILL